MFCIWDRHLAVKLWQNIWEMHETKIANSDDLMSINFATNGQVIRIFNQPPHDKTNKMACAPFPQSDQSLRCALSGWLRTQAFFKQTAKTLIRLIWVFAGRTCHCQIGSFSWGGSNYLASEKLERWNFCHMHVTYYIWATPWEHLFMPYANNKCAVQPAYPCSLISAFVVSCLDSIFL